MTARTLLLTAFALVAFAANSLLCRAALLHGGIGPLQFTLVRLGSGAVVLTLLRWIVDVVQRRRRTLPPGGAPRVRLDAWSAVALIAYAIPFSLAYVRMTAGTGALLLFGAVQITLLGVALARGERPRPLEWVGLALAVSGLVALVLPGLSAPPPGSALLMLGAGAAWGVYTLRGRRATDPLGSTGLNFGAATVVAYAAAMFGDPVGRAAPAGQWLAAASGALASGLGYAAWYAALPGLTRARAGIVQLAVPALAALGGVALLGEHVSLRLVGAAALILGGVGLAIAAHALPAAQVSKEGASA